ncbi:MAG: response regulator [Calditrichaceae bacterium]|nr:response regulator [Calditrichaceae bacterium]MBN2709374.1 response regulator [Calditrichaceae bacterium]RQV95748.1 MAG: response regulator [Calditrichota bacterium]
MKRYKILLVDDDPNMHRLVKFYLSEKEYNLECVTNGRSAHQKLQKAKFNLMISDIMMPVMDGITLISKIRAEGIDIPIIVTSAHNQENIASAAIEAGADKILEKPFSKEKLNAIIRDFITKNLQLNTAL